MPTIGGTALLNARRVGDRDAVIAGERRWTWRELDVDIASVAGAMRAAGLRKTDRVAVLCGNSAEFIIACHAASRLGAVVVPINTRLAVPEIDYIVKDSGAALLVYDPAHLAVAARISGVKAACLGPGSGHADLLADEENDPILDDRSSEDDDAFILYTSGTTGRPKGVLLDHHRAVWAAMAQIVSLGLRDGDRYLHLAPMYHSGGTTFLNATTLVGGAHIVVPCFDPSTALEAVQTHNATWLFGVPTLFQRILRQVDVVSYDLSSWRIGVFGAAPMPATTVEKLFATFPGVSFFQQCGQTEAGPTGIYSTMAQVRTRPNSSGHVAQPFTESRVVAADGTDAPIGDVGELVFRGEAVMKGYWANPVATAEALRDGWLYTGDLVEVTDDGAKRVVDRLKDVIITGGRNVYSAEVEQAIADHPGIVDVAVIGRRDEEWGETVVAVVTPADGVELSAEDIKAHCRARIADYKVPRLITFGAVPRNSTGKLQKHLLRT